MQSSAQVRCHPEGTLWEQLPAFVPYGVTGQNEGPDNLCIQPLLSGKMERKQLAELSYLCHRIPCKEALAYQTLTEITFCPAVFHVKLNHATFQSNTFSATIKITLCYFFLIFLALFPSLSALCKDIFMCVFHIMSVAKFGKHLKYDVAFFQTHNEGSLYQRPEHLAHPCANSTQTHRAMQLTPNMGLPPLHFPLKQINDQ